MSESKFCVVEGANIHYIEEGDGAPLVFLHGIPASAYLWRNIIPALSDKARCIAPDLIGMGESDKPDIKYTFEEHLTYIEKFIEQLNLQDITFVGHGLGAAIAFSYIAKHPQNVKAVAFCEAPVVPITDTNMLSLPAQSLLHSITFAEKEKAVEGFLNFSMINLHTDIKQEYKKSFAKVNNYNPLKQYAKEFAAIASSAETLQHSAMPKLMLYGNPGVFTSADAINWCSEHIPNLCAVDLEEGFHFPEESNPAMFGQILRDWYLNI